MWVGSICMISYEVSQSSLSGPSETYSNIPITACLHKCFRVVVRPKYSKYRNGNANVNCSMAGELPYLVRCTQEPLPLYLYPLCQSLYAFPMSYLCLPFVLSVLDTRVPRWFISTCPKFDLLSQNQNLWIYSSGMPNAQPQGQPFACCRNKLELQLSRRLLGVQALSPHVLTRPKGNNFEIIIGMTCYDIMLYQL